MRHVTVLYAEERQQAMARLVADRRRLSVTTLAEEFGVTTETVRRDLSALERAGLVRRVHGGAVPAGALAGLETGVSERDTLNADVKERIARAALDRLPGDGATVVIDAGSTTARLAAALPADRRLAVITHAVPVAARLAGHPTIDLRLLPGRVRPTTQAAVGADTVLALARLRADVVVLGTNGVGLDDAEHGLSTPDPDEAAVKRAMARAGATVIVLADSSKIGVESTTAFAALADVDLLVTDTGIRADDHAALVAAGVEVVVA